jgi:hypothetical protein
MNIFKAYFSFILLAAVTFFSSFANASEKYKVEISNQPCKQWLDGTKSAEILLNAKNLTNTNFTMYQFQVYVKDTSGNILKKSYATFRRLNPHGQASASVILSDLGCDQIGDLVFVTPVASSIDGEYFFTNEMLAEVKDGISFKYKSYESKANIKKHERDIGSSSPATTQANDKEKYYYDMGVCLGAFARLQTEGINVDGMNSQRLRNATSLFKSQNMESKFAPAFESCTRQIDAKKLKLVSEQDSALSKCISEKMTSDIDKALSSGVIRGGLRIATESFDQKKTVAAVLCADL